MFLAHGIDVYNRVGILVGILVTMSFLHPQLITLMLFASVAGLSAWAVIRCMRQGPAWAPLAMTLFGVVYVSWLLGHALSLRALPDGVEWIFLLVWITWIGESSAYFVGSSAGRIHLSPRISPAKTVEGAVAQLVVSPLAALAAHHCRRFMP